MCCALSGGEPRRMPTSSVCGVRYYTNYTGALCENLARVTPSESMSSETSVSHACCVLIKSRGTAFSPTVVVPVDMLAHQPSCASKVATSGLPQPVAPNAARRARSANMVMRVFGTVFDRSVPFLYINIALATIK